MVWRDFHEFLQWLCYFQTTRPASGLSIELIWTRQQMVNKFRLSKKRPRDLESRIRSHKDLCAFLLSFINLNNNVEYMFPFSCWVVKIIIHLEVIRLLPIHLVCVCVWSGAENRKWEKKQKQSLSIYSRRIHHHQIVSYTILSLEIMWHKIFPLSHKQVLLCI